jgi:hypothetical protein
VTVTVPMLTRMNFTLRAALVAVAAMGPLACARYELVSDEELPACANHNRPVSNRTFTSEQDSSAARGSLRGRVIMSGSRLPLPGTSVTLLTDPPRTTITDSLGAFTFTDVPTGSYLLRTRRIGIQSRADTLHLTHARAATFVLPLDAVMLDGPCSGFAALRVRKPWWKLW